MCVRIAMDATHYNLLDGFTNNCVPTEKSDASEAIGCVSHIKIVGIDLMAPYSFRFTLGSLHQVFSFRSPVNYSNNNENAHALCMLECFVIILFVFGACTLQKMRENNEY